MPGTLFVVATPIGNLEDITLRALRVLREVDLVAAEDTRRTGNLLRHYDIRAKLLSLHEHNEYARVPLVLDHLRAGRSIALVSDAGTPGISDPGALLVAAAREAGLPVIPVPGPSSLAAVLSVSGVEPGPMTFMGFPPTRSKDRAKWFDRLAELHDHTIVCYEAPHRVAKTLRDARSYLGKRQILLGREVTKVHEEWRVGSAAELLNALGEPVGEFVLLIGPTDDPGEVTAVASDNEIYRLFGQITDQRHLDRRAAVKEVSSRLGVAAKYAYEAIERAKQSGK